MQKVYGKMIHKYGSSDGPLSTASIGSRVRRVTLTATQIKALYSTPQTLIPAPGAGKIILVDKILAFLDYSTAAFTGSNALEFRYTDGSGAKCLLDFPYATLNATADAYAEVNKDDALVTPVVNAAVVAAVPSANPGGTTAASTLTFTIFYKVIRP